MNLADFLVQAKISTYADQKEVNEKTSPDGAKELNYQKGRFKYRDKYYGFNPFIGQEIVWRNNKIIWSMNYYGQVTTDTVSAKEVYQFLRQALRQVKKDRPFRGPRYLKNKNFQYFNNSISNIKQFAGTEKILFKGQEVYQLIYHGGTVKFK